MQHCLWVVEINKHTIRSVACQSGINDVYFMSQHWLLVASINDLQIMLEVSYHQTLVLIKHLMLLRIFDVWLIVKLSTFPLHLLYFIHCFFSLSIQKPFWKKTLFPYFNLAIQCGSTCPLHTRYACYLYFPISMLSALFVLLSAPQLYSLCFLVSFYFLPPWHPCHTKPQIVSLNLFFPCNPHFPLHFLLSVYTLCSFYTHNISPVLLWIENITSDLLWYKSWHCHVTFLTGSIFCLYV